jgi:hypothetical protein
MTCCINKTVSIISDPFAPNGNTLKVKTAKLGAAKLAPGTYTAADCPEFLVGDGSLVVTGGAFAILVR